MELEIRIKVPVSDRQDDTAWIQLIKQAVVHEARHLGAEVEQVSGLVDGKRLVTFTVKDGE